MLGVRTYEQAYIDACRAKIDADVAAYRAAVTTAAGPFESVFFNNMVLVLEALFMHRLRTVEGKDGNPLNEVRVLANSIMQNGAKLTADPAIKLSPKTSVLKLEYGDTIALTDSNFATLSTAFFAEIERKFV